jgi:hypothetical protein
MLNFCTLFNVNYLAKGLAMYDSLVANCSDFHLYIFAFDNTTYQVLTGKQLACATVIALADFETEALLAVKPERSVAEYCWTSTPLTIKHCLENYQLSHCTYLDADLFFYSDPKVLIDEMGDNSVLITPHNYHPKYDVSATAGIYCVQFVTIKATTDGFKVLNWWAQACIKWCFARYEDGKMGDQKYLDSWPYMFDGIYICRNAGAGLAPWNLLNYQYTSTPNTLGDKIAVDNTALIFSHFHDLKYFSNDSWYLGGYEVPGFVSEFIYQPYIKTLLKINHELKALYGGIDPLYTIDIESVKDLGMKFKVGTYVMDLEKSFKKFIADVFFISRKKHYKNYIRLK